MTDAELIIASQDDPAVFRKLYDRFADDLLAYFYRRVLDAEVAADLLAETFAVAFERRGRFKDVGRPGGAWLYGIAAKELSHWYRRQAVELRAARRLGIVVPPLDDESIGRIEALADGDAERAAVADALIRLPDGERVAVQLRVVEELDYAEIAARLHCTEGAARTRVHRGLQRLNACRAAGFAPLDAAYEPARARTARLERRLLALEASADCIAPAELARRVQLVLDRAGWIGWSAYVRADDREGRCGSVSHLGGDGERYVEGALDPVRRRVAVHRTASRRLTDLLFSAKSSLLGGLFDESGATCFTAAALRARATQVLAPERIDVTLRRIEFPSGGELRDEDGRWTRYLAGCTIVAGARPGADDHSVVIEVFRKR